MGNASNLPDCPTQGYGWHNCFGTYTDLNGTTYVGEWRDEKVHGQGTYTWKNGDKLIGQFKNGYADGQALAKTKERIYRGRYKVGKKDGQAVVITNANGMTHYASILYKNDEIVIIDLEFFTTSQLHFCSLSSDDLWTNCAGIYIYEDGGTYAGEWRNNKPSGQGFFIDSLGFRYLGEWKNGKENGEGKRLLPNGDFYSGRFIDGVLNSTQGTYNWKNGGEYKGEFKDRKPNGQGIKLFDGKEEYPYIGRVKDGHEHGYGTRYYPDGSIFSGSWKDSYKHGPGMLFVDGKAEANVWRYDERLQFQQIIKSLLPNCPRFYDPSVHVLLLFLKPSLGDKVWTNCFGFQRFKDGGTYAGEWKGNKFDGQGIFTGPTGSQYVGTWRNGTENGLGTLTSPNGTKYEGQFKDGKFHGEGTHTVYSNGEVDSIHEGIWKNGEFQNSDDASPPILTEVPTGQGEFISASSGSGFAVSKDGYIITNSHVTEGCQKIVVHSKNQDVLTRIITNDLQNDLALLKGDFSPSSVFPLSSTQPELLQDVYVAGYPFGQEISTSVKVTKGIISSLTGIGNNFSNIQIDAALQPGNSGGPILDEKGNLVGVAVAKLDLEYIIENYGVVPEGTNFGIKSSVVKNILDSYEVDIPAANQDEISKSELGEMISNGTYYISCWMTAAQIEKMQNEKVMFNNLK